MKWGKLEWSLLALAVVLIVSVILTGCGWLATAGPKVEEIAKKAAPFVPSPFNWILAAAGGVAGIVGSVAAGKRKEEIIRKAVAEGKSVHDAIGGMGLFTKLLTERKWAIPVAGAALTGASKVLLPELDNTTLMQIGLLLGIPTAGEFFKDGKAAAPATKTT